ncbi:hypothetical protein WOLCODRAFT_138125 [Wolfiporia cocos MD-104 SS10]|uniref:Uncharacterized protein n=1 Tax=Wolfiporia cocos (strain MD-104) TaxID=742152 RepID=A0A2H3JYJ5_WOLCO|nr:hypothetical protein WOLCODRAFT_138125 [Wolfiporia cocos MD-104 SS10]
MRCSPPSPGSWLITGLVGADSLGTALWSWVLVVRFSPKTARHRARPTVPGRPCLGHSRSLHARTYKHARFAHRARTSAASHRHPRARALQDKSA